MKSIFELWVSSFAGTDTQLFKLQGADTPETGLYQTRHSFEVKHNFYSDTPVYHVWVRGKWIRATTNYQEAVKSFEAEVKKITEASGEG